MGPGWFFGVPIVRCRREVTVCLPSSGGIFEVHIGYNCSRFPNPGPQYLVPEKTNILSVPEYPGTCLGLCSKA